MQSLNATGTASDTIYVAWRKPLREHCNGNVDRYWVCHQRVNETLVRDRDELASLPWPSELTSEDSR